ncbi:MAG: hypothetical protein JWM40_785 [Frankiales bacterium]|nr:hypothetical protein [Frankiales bacterium]
MRIPALVAVLLLGQGTAFAADYPPKPSGVTVTVSSSRVNVGACVNLFGNGFKPTTEARITDNGVFVAIVVADSNKRFTRQICFRSSATRGRHTLAASGTDANGFPASGSAVVTVLGVTVSNPTPRPTRTGSGGGSSSDGSTGGFGTTGGSSGGNGTTTGGSTGPTTTPTSTESPAAGGNQPGENPPPPSAVPGIGGGHGWLLPSILAAFGFLTLLMLIAMLARRRPEEQAL